MYLYIALKPFNGFIIPYRFFVYTPFLPLPFHRERLDLNLATALKGLWVLAHQLILAHPDGL